MRLSEIRGEAALDCIEAALELASKLMDDESVKDALTAGGGTTKQAHLYENLHTLDFRLSGDDIAELERAVEVIPVIGDRYDAEQQKRVLG